MNTLLSLSQSPFREVHRFDHSARASSHEKGPRGLQKEWAGASQYSLKLRSPSDALALDRLLRFEALSATATAKNVLATLEITATGVPHESQLVFEANAIARHGSTPACRDPGLLIKCQHWMPLHWASRLQSYHGWPCVSFVEHVRLVYAAAGEVFRTMGHALVGAHAFARMNMSVSSTSRSHLNAELERRFGVTSESVSIARCRGTHGKLA